MEHFNKLTPAEAERIAVLAEEAGEIVQVCGKILRHGIESRHPNGGPDNRALLEKEIGDFRFVYSMMIEAGDINMREIEKREHEKMMNIGLYLHHNKRYAP